MKLTIATKFGEMVQTIDNAILANLLDNMGKQIAFLLHEKRKAHNCSNEEMELYYHGALERLAIYLAQTIGPNHAQWLEVWDDFGRCDRYGITIYGVQYVMADWETLQNQDPKLLIVKAE